MVVPIGIVKYSQGDTQEEKQEALSSILGGLILGTPSFAGGMWLVRGLRQQHQKQISDRLDSAFYSLIEQQNGQISLLIFAKEAQISGEEAKRYLDTKAKEFNATFDLNPAGGIYYHFHL
ncbi:MAG: hypothetical protein QNJ47_26895 [Nostocaceae cyanobacterium]|nr:hypothetical protein [Nostocaceae cyanobacterium]